MAHRNLARRCTWQTGTDLGSDHLVQVITAAVSGRRPRRIRKERWAFRKADWTGFTAACETAAADLLQEDSVVMSFSGDVSGASGKYTPRGACTDPKPWALDKELTQAVEERRRARTAVQEDPSRRTRPSGKTRNGLRRTPRCRLDNDRYANSPLPN